jgi:hypothetical protein
MEDLERRFSEAVQHFRRGRRAQQRKQIEGGRIDAGTRGAVTGGTHMGGGCSTIVLNLRRSTVPFQSR